MDPQQVLTIGRDGLLTMLMVCAPILGVVLVLGLLISILQAATQIHEQTLSFVPKLLAAFAVLGLAGPWMLSTLVDYIRQVLMSIPSMVG
jgi:flagellar biosynthesis protein FliQ